VVSQTEIEFVHTQLNIFRTTSASSGVQKSGAPSSLQFKIFKCLEMRKDVLGTKIAWFIVLIG
jgi:hypothetical protein